MWEEVHLPPLACSDRSNLNKLKTAAETARPAGSDSYPPRHNRRPE